MGMLENFNKKQNHIAAHDPSFLIKTASPPYPKKESGVCLIIGTHPCVTADIDAALLAYPDAKLCAVNDASKIVPCDHIATCHPEKIEQFLKAHFDAWDENYTDPDLHVRDINEARNVILPVYKWAHNYGGGSAIFAAVTMIAIGFERVILCGCPIDGGGGYAIPTHEGTPDDPRLGNMSPDHSMVSAWHFSMRAMIDRAPEISSKIRSMSGFTKQLFGGIEK